MGAASRRDYAQDVRYIAIEHMDVRRDCLSLAHNLKNRGETPLPQSRDLCMVGNGVNHSHHWWARVSTPGSLWVHTSDQENPDWALPPCVVIRLLR